jgi:hypothetical protein
MRQSGGQCGNQRGGTACATLLGDGVVELQSEGLWGRAWPNPGRSVCPTPRRLLVAADRVSPGAPQPWAHARLNCHPTTATQPSWVLSAGGCSHRSAEVLFWPPPVASAPAGHASRTLRSATMAGSHIRAARMGRDGKRWVGAAARPPVDARSMAPRTFMCQGGSEELAGWRAHYEGSRRDLNGYR